jgi:hypothetical protein
VPNHHNFTPFAVTIIESPGGSRKIFAAMITTKALDLSGISSSVVMPRFDDGIVSLKELTSIIAAVFLHKNIVAISVGKEAGKVMIL